MTEHLRMHGVEICMDNKGVERGRQKTSLNLNFVIVGFNVVFFYYLIYDHLKLDKGNKII